MKGILKGLESRRTMCESSARIKRPESELSTVKKESCQREKEPLLQEVEVVMLGKLNGDLADAIKKMLTLREIQDKGQIGYENKIYILLHTKVSKIAIWYRHLY